MAVHDRYRSELDEVPPTMTELLEHYSNIRPADQINHIVRVRNAAWAAKQYPCLGRFWFLHLDLWQHPLYQQTLSLLKDDSSALFLDLGTCLGQDVRKLAFDGVPVSRIYAGDVVQDFIDIGYELFCDELKLPRDHFICPADVFDSSTGNPLSQLDNRVTVLHATAVFHLFDLPQQKRMADRCLQLLRKDAGKVLVLGSQLARTVAQEVAKNSGATRWVHNSESWKDMWEEVCGQQPWKGLVKTLEVKSTLEIPDVHELKMKEAKLVASGQRWMRYEVWITFNDGGALPLSSL